MKHLLGLTLIACAAWGCQRTSSSEPAQHRAQQAPATPSSTAEKDVTPAAPPAKKAATVMTDDQGRFRLDLPGKVFVVDATENRPFSNITPSNYCVGDRLYAGAAFRARGLNLFGPGIEALSSLKHGDVVFIHGEKKPNLFSQLKQQGPCSEEHRRHGAPIQMRSDWAPAEGAFETDEATLRGVSFLHAHGAAVVSLYEADHSDETQVAITLNNPFNLPLAGLDARLHYEGGPGKPMPKYVPVELPSVEPGGAHDFKAERRLPRGSTGGGVGRGRLKGSYLLHGLELEGTIGSATFELELGLLPPRDDD